MKVIVCENSDVNLFNHVNIDKRRTHVLDGTAEGPEEEVPKKTLSMGIGTILEAREIVLISDRSAKADAIRMAREGIGEGVQNNRIYPDEPNLKNLKLT